MLGLLYSRWWQFFDTSSSIFLSHSHYLLAELFKKGFCSCCEMTFSVTATGRRMQAPVLILYLSKFHLITCLSFREVLVSLLVSPSLCSQELMPLLNIEKIKSKMIVSVFPLKDHGRSGLIDLGERMCCCPPVCLLMLHFFLHRGHTLLKMQSMLI